MNVGLVNTLLRVAPLTQGAGLAVGVSLAEGVPLL
jgi:hypothetical protein